MIKLSEKQKAQYDALVSILHPTIGRGTGKTFIMACALVDISLYNNIEVSLIDHEEFLSPKVNKRCLRRHMLEQVIKIVNQMDNVCLEIREEHNQEIIIKVTPKDLSKYGQSYNYMLKKTT